MNGSLTISHQNCINVLILKTNLKMIHAVFQQISVNLAQIRSAFSKMFEALAFVLILDIRLSL